VPHIFSTIDRQRFFLVPDDVKLAPGPLRVQPLVGAPRDVDGEQAVAYEVDEATAKAFVQGRLAASQDLVRELGAWAAALERVSRDLARAPAPERVAELLRAAGVSDEELAGDPRAALRRVWAHVSAEAARAVKR
jgi:hypothetical protein